MAGHFLGAHAFHHFFLHEGSFAVIFLIVFGCFKQGGIGFAEFDVGVKHGGGVALFIHFDFDRELFQVLGFPDGEFMGLTLVVRDDGFVFDAGVAVDGFLADFGEVVFEGGIGFGGFRIAQRHFNIGAQARINFVHCFCIGAGDNDGAVHAHGFHVLGEAGI